MRRLLLVCIALSALAGCLGSEPEAGPLAAVETEEAPEPLEPVRIGEHIDLRSGLNETTWTLRVGAGHEERRVVARLDGFEGTGMVHMQNFCYFFEGRPDDGERIRRSGGVGCNSSGPAFSGGGAYTLLSMGPRDLPDGEYSFTFSAEPSLAVLVVEMVADYGQDASGANQSAPA